MLFFFGLIWVKSALKTVIELPLYRNLYE